VVRASHRVMTSPDTRRVDMLQADLRVSIGVDIRGNPSIAVQAKALFAGQEWHVVAVEG
jgi:hypothetical protein